MKRFATIRSSHPIVNMNWHLWSDGAKRGLKVMRPVGGGVGYYWNYTKKTWEYYGNQPIER